MNFKKKWHSLCKLTSVTPMKELCGHHYCCPAPHACEREKADTETEGKTNSVLVFVSDWLRSVPFRFRLAENIFTKFSPIPSWAQAFYYVLHLQNLTSLIQTMKWVSSWVATTSNHWNLIQYALISVTPQHFLISFWTPVCTTFILLRSRINVITQFIDFGFSTAFHLM
jgi:hypothetical protein